MSSVTDQKSNEMSKSQRLFFIIAASILMPLISSLCIWGGWTLFIKQMIAPSPELVGDPLYVMSAFFGASFLIGSFAGFFSIYNVILCVRQKRIFQLSREIKLRKFYKGVLILVAIGGSFAFISNIILLHKIIPDNGYVLCPKKIGYKKNLLRDYVLDVSQCEKF